MEFYSSDNTKLLPVYPTNPGTPLVGSSGNVAAGVATASLAAAAGKTNFVTGFQINGSGATAASVVLATLTGLNGGTMTYPVVIPAGVGAAVPSVSVTFNPPIPASAPNTAITVSVPSFGSGNTNAAVNIQGFQV